MDKFRDFFENFNWKRAGKVALVIVPALLWQVWYTTIKYVNIANEKIDKAGEEFLSNFMDGK